MKQNSREKISIIVIIYNVETYLADCINSIKGQTYKNLEIILVDDGSTDKSKEMCDRFAEDDDRVLVIHKDNGGLVSARQAGIKVATGKYVAFVDGDDWVEKDMYENLYLTLQLYKADIVISGIIREYPHFRKYNKNSIPNGYYDKNRLEEDVYSNMMYAVKKASYAIDPSLCNKLFKTDIIKQSLLQVDENIFYLGEDAAAMYPCLLNAESIYVTDSCMYHHRQILGEESPNYKREKLYERLLIFYSSMKERFENTIYASRMLPQLNGYFLNLLNIVIREAVDFDMQIFLQYMMEQKQQNLIVKYQLPLRDLEKYKNVILFGAGKVGMQYYAQLEKSNINVVLWIDKKYKILRNSGLPVNSIDDLDGKSYDIIIIAVKQEEIADSMKKELDAKGISEERIKWIKPVELKID